MLSLILANISSDIAQFWTLYLSCYRTRSLLTYLSGIGVICPVVIHELYGLHTFKNLFDFSKKDCTYVIGKHKV